jgi:hypothetical protein
LYSMSGTAKSSRYAFALAALFCAIQLPARAQDQGPLAAPPKFEVNRIPSVPHPGPPPIPVEQIIQKFAANEDAMKKAFDDYYFTQTIRVEELGDPGGKFTVSGEMYTKPSGDRFWRITSQPVSTMKVLHISLEDVRAIIGFPAFALTTDEIGNYNFLYAGQDKLDELNTYVFQVKPKQLSRAYRFFEGAIWVDDHDLAIVKSYGKFVSELSGSGAKLPFTMFETYRQNFQEKYWLPTYTNSDDYVDGSEDTELHLRLVIRSTDFKLNPSQGAPATAASSDVPAAAPPKP